MMMLLLWLAAACLTVEGEVIHLADFARALPAFAAADASVQIGFAPAFGAKRSFAPAEVARLGARYAVDVPLSNPGVCFERPGRSMEAEELQNRLRAALPDGEARLAVIDFARYPVPAGPLEFDQSGLQRVPSGDGTRLWRGRAVYGNHRSYPVWAKVKLSWPCTRAVAAADLAAGSVVSDTDIRLESSECPSPPGAFASRVEDAAGKLLRTRIAAGAPIPLRLLAAAPLVKRGEEVEVTVHSGAAQLKLTAHAQKPGAAGDTIPVRNPSSGKVFPARVLGQGRVAVGGER